MKKMSQRIMILFILLSGTFIGVVKGQEAKNRWIGKMKGKQTLKKSNPGKSPREVLLDDYEIATFHRQ
jgi:hypothetical protein